MLLHEFDGAAGYLSCTALSGDKKIIDSGGKTTQIWQADTGQLISTFDGHDKDHIGCLDLNHDGSLLVFARKSYRKNTIEVWGLEGEGRSRVLQTLVSHTEEVHAVKLSPDGQKIASINTWWGKHENKLAIIWSAQSGEKLQILNIFAMIFCVAWSPDSKLLGTGGDDDYAVKVWDVITGEQIIQPLKIDNNHVRCLAFDSKSSFLVAGTGMDSVVVWWLSKHGSDSLRYMLEGHKDIVCGVSVSPDDMHMASWSLDSTIRVWNVDTGHLMRVLTGTKIQWSVGGVAWSSNGQDIQTFVNGGRTVSVLRAGETVCFERLCT
jgi:WD40 repeat protein